LRDISKRCQSSFFVDRFNIWQISRSKKQGCGSGAGFAFIRFILESWIRIPHYSEKLDPDPDPHSSKIQELLRLKLEPLRGSGPLQWSRGGSKNGAWRVCKAVVAHSHHIYEEQDPDAIRVKVERWIRIRINVMRIRNPGLKDDTRVSAKPLSISSICMNIIQTACT
jgi:hypothetical protein